MVGVCFSASVRQQSHVFNASNGREFQISPDRPLTPAPLPFTEQTNITSLPRMAPTAKAKLDKEEKQKPDRADQVARLMGLLHRDHTQPHEPPPPDEDDDQDHPPAAAAKPAAPSAAASRCSNSGRRAAPESADGSSASARRSSTPPSPSHGMAPSVSWEGHCSSRGATAESPRYANAPPPQQQQMRGRPRPQAVQAPSPRGAQAVARSFNDGGVESPHTPPDQPPPRIGPTASSPHSGAGLRALPRPKTGEQLQGPPLPSPRGAPSPKTWSNPDGAAPGHAAAPRKNRAPSIRLDGVSGDDVTGSGGTTPKGAAARPSSSTGRRDPNRACSMGDFPDARLADGGSSGALMPPLSPLGSAGGGARSAVGARGRRVATKHASLGNQEYERMHVATSPGPVNPSLSPLHAGAVPRAGGKQAAALPLPAAAACAHLSQPWRWRCWCADRPGEAGEASEHGSGRHGGHDARSGGGRHRRQARERR
ncbi:unnamed protein product [Closterium sp. Naga37s-1]|nr:unnamed protein product [Closterium sp. Naga37s-1]